MSKKVDEYEDCEDPITLKMIKRESSYYSDFTRRVEVEQEIIIWDEVNIDDLIAMLVQAKTNAPNSKVSLSSYACVTATNVLSIQVTQSETFPLTEEEKIAC